MDWREIALIVFVIISAVLGVGWKLYARKLAGLLRESGEFLQVAGDALVDGDITPEELARIIYEAMDVQSAFASLLILLRR